jgi:hypothetical protein
VAAAILAAWPPITCPIHHDSGLDLVAKLDQVT